MDTLLFASNHNVILSLDRNSKHVFCHHNLAAATNLKIGFFQASAEQVGDKKRQLSLSSRLSSSHFPQSDLGDLGLIIRTDGNRVSHSGDGPGPDSLSIQRTKICPIPPYSRGAMPTVYNKTYLIL